MRRILKWAAGIIIGLFALLIVLAILFPSSPRQEANPSVKPQATAKLQQLANAKPTNTPNPTATPKPTSTPKLSPTPSSTPTPKPTNTPLPSSFIVPGGFGDTKDGLTSKYGKPKDSGSVSSFQDGKYLAMYSNNRVWNFTVSFEQMPGKRVPLQDAQKTVKALIPTDSSFIKSYSPDADRLVEVYTSPSLAQLFEAKLFIVRNGPHAPGQFIAIYKQAPKDQVFSVVFGLGDNP